MKFISYTAEGVYCKVINVMPRYSIDATIGFLIGRIILSSHGQDTLMVGMRGKVSKWEFQDLNLTSNHQRTS